MVPYQTLDVIWNFEFVILLTLVLFHHNPISNFSLAKEVSIRALLYLCQCKYTLKYLWCGNTCSAFIKLCGFFVVPSPLVTKRLCLCPIGVVSGKEVSVWSCDLEISSPEELLEMLT